MFRPRLRPRPLPAAMGEHHECLVNIPSTRAPIPARASAWIASIRPGPSSFERMTTDLNNLQPLEMAGKGGFPGKIWSRAFAVRARILLAGFVLAILCLVFFMAWPSATRGKFPARFSDDEKREITSLISSDAYHQSVRALGHGELRQTWRWIAKARDQEVYAVGNQPDGHLGSCWGEGQVSTGRV